MRQGLRVGSLNRVLAHPILQKGVVPFPDFGGWTLLTSPFLHVCKQFFRFAFFLIFFLFRHPSLGGSFVSLETTASVPAPPTPNLTFGPPKSHSFTYQTLLINEVTMNIIGSLSGMVGLYEFVLDRSFLQMLSTASWVGSQHRDLRCSLRPSERQKLLTDISKALWKGESQTTGSTRAHHPRTLHLLRSWPSSHPYLHPFIYPHLPQKLVYG